MILVLAKKRERIADKQLTDNIATYPLRHDKGVKLPLVLYYGLKS
jgi:hypothetical protein